MNKLEIINKSVSEIREKLGAECVNIEDLPGLIDEVYSQTPNTGGNTTAFIFSSSVNPVFPSGGTLNLDTGLVEGLNGDWAPTVQYNYESAA